MAFRESFDSERDLNGVSQSFDSEQDLKCTFRKSFDSERDLKWRFTNHLIQNGT